MVKRLSSNGSRKRKQHMMLDRSPGESRASHEEHRIDPSGDIYHVVSEKQPGSWGRGCVTDLLPSLPNGTGESRAHSWALGNHDV